ncbi:viroplasmin family protein, partial [Candidatus Liberibacter asiaticus]
MLKIENEKTSSNNPESNNNPKKKKKINWANEVKKEDLKKVYVVYNETKPRIYTSWPETSRAIIGFSRISHRTFINMIESGSY